MTLEKVNKINGFLLVDKINRLLLYQRFKALFFKKHLSDTTKKFLWVILHLKLSGRCFLYKLFISA
ncbi:peptidase [Enterococcus faecium]|nr:peptidase [Enterococcus faecium]RSA56927.1 peptidase [Enterococcus faecium]RSA65974.1 peptidase [Enterococcus faecium]RYJ81753.1 peptidase [Enterococcus faecium]